MATLDEDKISQYKVSFSREQARTSLSPSRGGGGGGGGTSG